jgi:YceI-like domain
MMSWLLLLLVGTGPLAGHGIGDPAPRRLVYRVIQDASDIWVVTHRSGLLSFLGHEHAITAHEWTTRLCVSDPVADGDEASLVVAISSLVIDSDSARSLAGFGGSTSADERREIQRKMLDSEHLDAEAFPEARLDLRAVGKSGERTTVEGTFTLHGVRQDVKFQLSTGREGPDRLRLSGELRIHQRDYGIEPESIKGVVKV